MFKLLFIDICNSSLLLFQLSQYRQMFQIKHVNKKKKRRCFILCANSFCRASLLTEKKYKVKFDFHVKQAPGTRFDRNQ
jgi:hypothetical protein